MFLSLTDACGLSTAGRTATWRTGMAGFFRFFSGSFHLQSLHDGTSEPVTYFFRLIQRALHMIIANEIVRQGDIYTYIKTGLTLAIAIDMRCENEALIGVHHLPKVKYDT